MINLINPNPGSDKAVELGCKCPRMDNGYGRGSYKDGWIINMECKVHNIEPDDFMKEIGDN